MIVCSVLVVSLSCRICCMETSPTGNSRDENKKPITVQKVLAQQQMEGEHPGTFDKTIKNMRQLDEEKKPIPDSGEKLFEAEHE